MADDSLTQSNRNITVTTPLGDDVLVLLKFSGREALSEPFEFTLEMLSTTLTVDATSIVGKAVTFTTTLADDSTRYFNGMVADFAACETDATDLVRRYTARVVPWFWFMSLVSNCRIFQQKSIPDIIEQLFSDLGFSDYEKQLTQTYNPLDYCVQYRESDFDFASRLMEAAGIFYFFKHENGKHTMVLADDASKYIAATENTASYFGDVAADALPGCLTSWSHGFQFTPGKFSQTDYNFTTPTTDLSSSESTVVPLSGLSSYELFEYPGRYGTASDGTAIAKIRMQEREWVYEQVESAGTYGSFSPGYTFQVSDHPVDGEKNKTYVLVSVEHRATEPVQYYAEATPMLREPYNNRFTCIPSSTVFRPPRRTPWPQINGPQSAVVVGSSGQEMLTEQYGRVKVQFTWDRLGTNDENSSCWIRVAQNLAGNTWGMQFLPRVGQEVLVEFLNGDPDQPIITGSVYNANQMPPYALPDSQNKSGLRTRSTASGDDTTFNELTFDDTKGQEQVYFHAERDYVREVENNDSLKVGYDLKNPGDQTIQIYNNRTVTIENGTDSLEVQTADRKVTIDKGNDSITISEGNRTITLSKGNLTVTLDEGNQAVTLTKGNDSLTLSAGNQSVTLDKGNHSIECSAGSSSISAMQSIELKVGGNSIQISQQGITIKGTMISVEGDTQTTVKGAMVSVNGSGMVQVEGGMITLN